MLYELRMYHVAPGRLADVAARMRDLVPPMFEKHGFPTPLGQWWAVAGAKMPLYVWLLCWPNSEIRAKAFASLYGDAAWMGLRAATNGPREMVLNYDILLMHAAPAWDAAKRLHGDVAGPAGGLHELRVHDVYPGRGSQAQLALAEVDLPAWKRAGARTLGIFDVQSGHGLPSVVQFLAWSDFAARTKGLATYGSDPDVTGAREEEASELKTHLLGRYDSWLLEPMPFGTPNHGFGSMS